jgi:hypothetical protein
MLFTSTSSVYSKLYYLLSDFSERRIKVDVPGTLSLVLRRGIIAKYVAVRSHHGIILPQMGQTRDEALESTTC